MNRKKNKLQKSNEELDEKIREIYYKSKRRYGAPKIYKTLKKNGENVSLKRVQRRMTILGIKSVVVKKYQRKGEYLKSRFYNYFNKSKMECRYNIHSYRKRWLDISCIS